MSMQSKKMKVYFILFIFVSLLGLISSTNGDGNDAPASNFLLHRALGLILIKALCNVIFCKKRGNTVLVSLLHVLTVAIMVNYA